MKPNCALGTHDWMGCKCYICGETRDEGHEWSSLDCESCGICAKTREKAHNWSNDCERCSRCGATREGFHNWQGSVCSVCGSGAAVTSTGIGRIPLPLDRAPAPQEVVLGVSKDIAAFIQDEVAIAVGRSIFTSAGLIVVNFCLIVFLPGFGPQLAGLLFLPGLYFITRAILGSRKVFRLLEENPSFEAGPWARRGAVKALVIGLAPVPFLGGAVAISMALGDAIPAAIIVLAVSFGLSAVVFFFVLPSSSRGHSAS